MQTSPSSPTANSHQPALSAQEEATPEQVSALQKRITDEIFWALGQSKTGLLRRLLGWVFYLPTHRFAQIFSAADAAIANGGMSAGCRRMLPELSIHLETRGAEALPAEGPLLIVSNHPGAYDSISLGSCVQRRDLKIMVWEIPFYRALTHANQWFIYVTNDSTNRMLGLRSAIQHLKSGGALLTFGTGIIEPDPAIASGTETAIEAWSPSVEVMVRKAPETRLCLAIASGVVAAKFAPSPLTRLRREPVDQRRIAEFTQVISQMISPRVVQPNVRLSFAPPVTIETLSAESGGGRLLPAIKARAQRLLQEHLAAW